MLWIQLTLGYILHQPTYVDATYHCVIQDFVPCHEDIAKIFQYFIPGMNS